MIIDWIIENWQILTCCCCPTWVIGAFAGWALCYVGGKTDELMGLD